MDAVVRINHLLDEPLNGVVRDDFRADVSVKKLNSKCTSENRRSLELEDTGSASIQGHTNPEVCAQDRLTGESSSSHVSLRPCQTGIHVAHACPLPQTPI